MGAGPGLLDRAAGPDGGDACGQDGPDGGPADEQTAYEMDGSALPPQPAPFTTLAWRVAHIVDCLQAERTATWFGVLPEPDDGQPVVPGTADAALDALDQAYAAWRRRVAAIDEAALALPMGEVAQPYADQSRAAFVLHILDEMIHHGAEVCLVRDLYRADRLRDPFVAAGLGGDRAQVDALRADDPTALDSRPDEPPRPVVQGRLPAAMGCRPSAPRPRLSAQPPRRRPGTIAAALRGWRR